MKELPTFHSSGLKIYIAENDEDYQIIFKTAFEKLNFNSNVKFFFNGEELIKYLSSVENNNPDLIILDARMPVMDGLETLKKIKLKEKTNKIPVILMSGLIDNTIVDEVYRSGAADYIMKPFSLEGLINVLELIEKHAGETSLACQ